MKLNLVDIGERNDLSICEIIETPVAGGEPIRSLHRRVVDSRQDLSGEVQVIQDIAADMAYDETPLVDGARTKIKRIRVIPSTGEMAVTRMREVVENGEVIASETLPTTIVDMVDDTDTDPKSVAMKARHHTPERVQAEIARRAAAAPKKDPEYELKDKPFSRVERINGKPTLVKGTEKVVKTRPVRVENEDGSPAFHENGKPMFVEEKILVRGR